MGLNGNCSFENRYSYPHVIDRTITWLPVATKPDSQFSALEDVRRNYESVGSQASRPDSEVT